MLINEINNIPTSDDILTDLYKKYIWNNKLIEFAKERRIFIINNKEYYISEVKNLQVTFTNIEDDTDITKYIEDLQGIKVTDYVLVLEWNFAFILTENF